MTTTTSYLSIVRDLGKWRTIAGKSPDVALESAYFKAHIGKAVSIEAFLKDRRLFSYAMKAFGLGDQISAMGLMRKVLEQGVANPKALAHTLNNANILAFAKTFDFAAKGAATPSTALIDEVSARYVEGALQSAQGRQNPGVELALYFRQNAPALTTIYGVLADKKLLTVVQTALGLSPRMSAQSVDTQARLLKAKVKIEDFKDAKKLDAFIARFAAMYDLQNGGGMSADVISSNPLLYSAAQSGSDTPVGVDFNLILRMQNAARTR